MDLFYSHVTQNKVCNVKYKVLFLPHGLYGIILCCEVVTIGHPIRLIRKSLFTLYAILTFINKGGVKLLADIVIIAKN
jgi:hypothetical protein